MPARKKDRNETGLFNAAAITSVTPANLDRGYETGAAQFPIPGDPRGGRKHASVPKQVSEEEQDQHLILTYLTCLRLLEHALVRAGFVMALSSYKQARPDWYGWARHIEKQFVPASDDVLQMSVDHLLDLRDDMEALPGRMQNRITWESASRFSDNLWLAEMLQRTGSQLTHRYNFAETPGCDTPQVMAALMVVEAWLQLVQGQ